MSDSRFLRNVLIKGVSLFLVFNLLWALFSTPALGKISLYNSVLRGRQRFPFGENPAESYNLSLYDLDAMFASHQLNAAPKPADEFRVFVLGDSATWGTLLRAEQTLPGLLDEAALATASGKQVRVYNLGYPTLSLFKDLMILEEAMNYQPDLILWPLTLESFPRDRQLESPIVLNNPRRVRRLIESYDINLPIPEAQSSFWSRTLFGQRRALADLIRLQFYGVMWSATGIDQVYPTDYVPAEHDLEADPNFNGWKNSFPQEALAFDVISAAMELAGEVPLWLINEPMLISEGANSDIRYNFYYPRWAYDDYLQLMKDKAGRNGWVYHDLHDLVPQEHFTNSAIHLDPAGEEMFGGVVAEKLRQYIR